MKIQLVSQESEIAALTTVMSALRPQYAEAELTAAMTQQWTQHNYQLLYAMDDSQQVLAVAGFVIGHKLAWGKHLYVDDLVTLPTSRSTGVGAAMLEWLKDYARLQGCEQLHLDSGVQRFDAHRFYLRHGMHIASHHFSLSL